MNFVKQAYRRIRALFTESSIDRDMEREMNAHIEILAEELERSGMSRAEATLAASRRFGNVLQLKERGHDIKGAGILGNVVRDVKYALRNLSRTPVFTLTVVVTLALGIGANTALFSVIDRLLLRPLPYPGGEQLMMVYESMSSLNTTRNVVSPANWLDWQRDNETFDSLAAWNTLAATLTGQGEPERLNGEVVSAEFFPLLRILPQLGRTFTSSDDQPQSPCVVILSHRLWQRQFGGDDAVIGRKIEMDSNNCEIVGVMPVEFHFVDDQIDFWAPYQLDRQIDWRQTGGRFMNVVGRLKPSITQPVAQAEMDSIGRRLAETYTYNRGTSVTVVPLRDALTDHVKGSLLALFGAVAVLILIACFNVASMLLARSASRRQELAVRVSLGASRWVILRQLLIESVVLAITGGVAGIVVAQVGIRALVAMAPQNPIGLTEVPLDLRLLAYALALSVLTGCIFGLAPALSATRRSPGDYLKDTSRHVIGSGRLRQTLVIAQVAMTVILLCGAGLFIRSLRELLGTTTGLDAQNVLTMYVQPPNRRYNSVQRVEFVKRIIEGLRALPGVQAAAAALSMPLIGPTSNTVAHVRGTPPIFQNQDLNGGLRVTDLKNAGSLSPGGLLPRVRVVTPSYFKTLRIPILRGREFVPEDQVNNAPPVFIVNEALATKFLGQDPLSASISVLMAQENPYGRVVGVVGNTIEGSLRERAEPTVFYAQGNNRQEGFPSVGMTILVRSSSPDIAKPSMQVVHDIDPNQPVTQVRMLQDVVSDSVSRERLTAVLSAVFALTALLLAALGVYGLLGYSVAERTREIGVRIALGARPLAVLQMIMNRGLLLVAAGIVIGVSTALAIARFMQSLLFGVRANDPTTFVVAAFALLSAGTIAAFIPARRATKVDPIVALRHD